jgi:hypothetical protein
MSLEKPERVHRSDPPKPSAGERLGDGLIAARPLVGAVGIFVLGSFVFFSFRYAFGIHDADDHSQHVFDIIHNVLEGAVIISGLVWFFITAQANPRVAFDIDCAFFRPRANFLVVELRFVFENKGFVEHFIRNLECSVHTVDEQAPQIFADDEEFAFRRRILPSVEAGRQRLDVLPRGFKYFYVRPGVRQTITRVAWLPPDTDIIRITSGFTYSFLPGDIHTAQRVFLVPPDTSRGECGPIPHAAVMSVEPA